MDFFENDVPASIRSMDQNDNRHEKESLESGNLFQSDASSKKKSQWVGVIGKSGDQHENGENGENVAMDLITRLPDHRHESSHPRDM